MSVSFVSGSLINRQIAVISPIINLPSLVMSLLIVSSRYGPEDCNGSSFLHLAFPPFPVYLLNSMTYSLRYWHHSGNVFVLACTVICLIIVLRVQSQYVLVFLQGTMNPFCALWDSSIM